MRNLQTLLQKLYPSQYEYVLSGLRDILPAQETTSKTDPWYKDTNIYVVYPEAFKNGTDAGLNELTVKLEYLQNLGIETIHILPLLKSPMIDAGFDISDYLSIREDLGGNNAFEILLQEAKDRNVKIIIDLVLNHISNQHEWFQKAEQGDEKYRNYFVYTKEKPKLLDKYVNEDGPFAAYELNGKRQDFRIIFPEFVGELPHWVQGKDGYWYFHTFYPHQLDVDWNNPDVFLEFSKILAYWARKGLSFRLDAAIFLGKRVFDGEYINPPNVHTFIQALHVLLSQINSESVFLGEVVESLEEIKHYFNNKDVKECDLNYNFPLMNDLWISAITGNIDCLWEDINESAKNMPEDAGWVTFLRNHDGFTLEFASQETFSACHRYFEQNKRGEPFMAGFNIAGRTMNFLDNNKDALIALYLALASIPGSPAIMYGDEIGKQNDFEFMKEKTAIKRRIANDDSIQDDLRDINRGHISNQDIEANKDIFNEFANIFTTRKRYKKMFGQKLVRLQTPQGIFAGKYVDQASSQELTFYVNLSKSPFSLNSSPKDILYKTPNVHREGTSYTLPKWSGVWLVEQH